MKNIYEVNYMDDEDIDERIKNICLQAENNYIMNYTKDNNNKERKNISLEKIIINSNSDISPLDKTMTYSNEENNNNENIYQRSQNGLINNKLNNEYNEENDNYKNIYQRSQNDLINNKLNNKYNKENDNFKNLYQQSQNDLINNKRRNEYNTYNEYNENNIQIKREINSSRNNFIRNKNRNNNRNTRNNNRNNSNISQEMINSMNNKIKYRSNNMISPNDFETKNENNGEDIVNYNSQLLLSQSEIRSHYNHSNLNNTFFSSSPSFCFECDLQKLINDNNIYNKDLYIKSKENKEINKIILNAKILLVKNKLKKVYDYLKIYINSNITNPDLYYLYGETCRKLKYMEDAEKYLLACMNYKNCSPYVYLSLAELYNEIGQIKFSKQFYKKCLLYFNKGNIYCNLAKNYLKLNKPLKALNFITEAINLDQNEPKYYKFRSEVYEILGHKKLSEKDIYQYNILIKN